MAPVAYTQQNRSPIRSPPRLSHANHAHIYSSARKPRSRRGTMGNALYDSVVPHHTHGARTGGAGVKEELGLAARMKPRVVSQTALDDISRRVRAQSDRFQAALMPVGESVKGFAESSPVLFTFVAIFASLSFIPGMLFLGFVTTCTVFMAGTAILLLCIGVAGTLLIGRECFCAQISQRFTFLFPVLVFTGAVAVIAVAVLLGLFLAHRLYLHLNDASASAGDKTALETITTGLRSWADETRSRVGLGPYQYRHTAFEDYKASPPVSKQTLEKPRIQYEEIVADYSTRHPQPTPSFQVPRKSDGSDLFAPKPVLAQAILAEPVIAQPTFHTESLSESLLKHEPEDEWESQSDGTVSPGPDSHDRKSD